MPNDFHLLVLWLILWPVSIAVCSWLFFEIARRM